MAKRRIGIRGPKLQRRQMRALTAAIVVLLAAILGIGGTAGGASNGGTGLEGCSAQLMELSGQRASISNPDTASSSTLASVPAYSGHPYAVIDASQDAPDGAPVFTDAEISRAESGAFEDYSSLDALGRCGTALACVGTETMPTGKRGDIHEVHPTGWRQRFYDFIDQEALYNRCHLIAHSLAGEDANARNLITGTRSMNTQGMLPFEEATVDYIRSTGNHVLYRVTPIFQGDELVARGVHMEARSVEDDGAGILFNVYCYNVEPCVEIDYATGENRASVSES